MISCLLGSPAAPPLGVRPFFGDVINNLFLVDSARSQLGVRLAERRKPNKTANGSLDRFCERRASPFSLFFHPCIPLSTTFRFSFYSLYYVPVVVLNSMFL